MCYTSFGIGKTLDIWATPENKVFVFLLLYVEHKPMLIQL